MDNEPKQCCGNCYYTRRPNRTTGTTECHRNPPVVMFYKDGATRSAFPILNKDNWCGHWISNRSDTE